MHVFTRRFLWISIFFLHYGILIAQVLPLDFNVKFELQIDWTIIKILWIPLMEYFYLITSTTCYHDNKYRTINLLVTKYGRDTLNTLKAYKRTKLWTCIELYEDYLTSKFKSFKIFFNGYIAYVCSLFYKTSIKCKLRQDVKCIILNYHYTYALNITMFTSYAIIYSLKLLIFILSK